MSFIPASKMPHAKPHDEHDHEHHGQHDAATKDGGNGDASPAPMTATDTTPAASDTAPVSTGAPSSTPEASSTPAPATSTPASTPALADSAQDESGGKAPWGIALAVGGVLAIGAAVAAVVFRGGDKPAAKGPGKPQSAKAARKAAKKSGQ